MNLYKLLTLITFISLFSCSDYLDVNDDPNRSSQADAGSLFTGTVVQYSNNRVIDLGPTVSTAAQLWSGGGSLGAGVFTDPEQYVFSVFTTGNTWRAYYREIQKNLQLAINNAEGRSNTIAQCEIVSAMTYYSTTVLWGDVPYSEALDIDFENVQIENLAPGFDPQEAVLQGVLNILDTAIDRIDPGVANAIVNGDVIYNGDMDKWRKFAKSLKLRTLLTMVDADPSKAGDIGALIAEGDLIVTPDDNAEMPFYSNPGNRNPFWGTLNSFAGGSNLFFFASEAMVDVMKGNDDPRLGAYFRVYPGGDSDSTEVFGAPAGVSNVQEQIGSQPWVLSTSTSGSVDLIRPDAPDVWFSAQETNYYIAEAIVKGYASGDASQFFRDGVTIAMQNYGIGQSEIDDYINNSIGDLGSGDSAIEVIANEQFVDCIIRPLEGWTNWRRNEYPALNVPFGAQVGNLARRLPLPPDEVAANASAPSPKAIDVKMWFDK